MSKLVNDKKCQQLGMPVGTASAKLKKSVLFHLVKKLGENYCFQCNKEITSEEDLSIEHKIPYLDSTDPVGLFFDLDNIAFSHLSCNCAAARQNKGEAKHPSQEAYKKGCRCKECLEIMRKRYERDHEVQRKKMVKTKILPLIKEGLSYRDIEKELRISKQTVCNYMKKYGSLV